MLRMRRRRRALCTLLLVALAGCRSRDAGPDPVPEPKSPAGLYADACAKIVACDCRYSPFEELDTCLDFVAGHYDSVADNAAVAGLTMDWGCIETDLGITQYGCGASPLPDYEPKCAYCGLAYGERQVGETCVQIWRGDLLEFSDCDRGLICDDVDDICWDPCAPPQIGSRCPALGWGDDLVCDTSDTCQPGVVGEGAACYGPVVCEAGLVCAHPDPNLQACMQPRGEGLACADCPDCCDAGLGCDRDTAVCAPLAGLGASCASIDCVAGSYCELSLNTCQPLHGAGEPCSSDDCQPDLICNEHTCIHIPGLGEPCPERICDDDLNCGEDGVCHPGDPEVCLIKG